MHIYYNYPWENIVGIVRLLDSNHKICNAFVWHDYILNWFDDKKILNIIKDNSQSNLKYWVN